MIWLCSRVTALKTRNHETQKGPRETDFWVISLDAESFVKIRPDKICHDPKNHFGIWPQKSPFLGEFWKFIFSSFFQLYGFNEVFLGHFDKILVSAG